MEDLSSAHGAILVIGSGVQHPVLAPPTGGVARVIDSGQGAMIGNKREGS